MYSNICDVTCLNNLVGIKGECSTDNCHPYYIEDIDGVTLNTLADLAKPQQISGAQYGKDLINSSARIMLAEVQAQLNTSGYTLIDAFAETCSNCTFTTTSQVGGGVKVRNLVGSKFSVLKIKKIDVLANATGPQIIVFDDGKVKVEKTFIAMGNGVIVPLELEYSTREEMVSISLKDTSIPMGLILCETVSGCGCGGGNIKAQNIPVAYSGMVYSMNTENQYGFKVCASVECSSDIITCQLVATTPNIFGLTLLYKVAEKYYSESPVNSRLNRTAGFDDEPKKTLAEKYEGLYREMLAGSTKVKGVKTVIAEFLKINSDRCVSCSTPFSTAYAIG